ncbi:hypothetical protein ABW20_dc0105240 [Dactylellina cionopaga]|nr:hypothetical protein ABW20_dc0105240 [Dactylellina cionopaga]
MDRKMQLNKKYEAAVAAYWELEEKDRNAAAVAREHNVDPKTLRRRLKGVQDESSTRWNRVLKPCEEEELLDWILTESDKGNPPRSRSIAARAVYIAQQSDPSRTSLGRDWPNRFVKRHKSELEGRWVNPIDKRCHSPSPTPCDERAPLVVLTPKHTKDVVNLASSIHTTPRSRLKKEKLQHAAEKSLVKCLLIEEDTRILRAELEELETGKSRKRIGPAYRATGRSRWWTSGTLAQHSRSKREEAHKKSIRNPKNPKVPTDKENIQPGGIIN